MSDLNDLISRLPIDDLAKQVGASPEDVRAATEQAIPTLVAGLAAQTGDDEQTTKLAGAIAKHDGALAEGSIDLSQVDSADGEKIVSKMFGDDSDGVAQGISGAVSAAAVDQGLIKKLLPLLAPIVLSYVMGQFGKKGTGTGTQASGGGLGDLLGGMLGGQNTGGLGSVLGQVLGGGKSGGGNGGLGSILGSILGGK